MQMVDFIFADEVSINILYANIYLKTKNTNCNTTKRNDELKSNEKRCSYKSYEIEMNCLQFIEYAAWIRVCSMSTLTVKLFLQSKCERNTFSNVFNYFKSGISELNNGKRKKITMTATVTTISVTMVFNP